MKGDIDWTSVRISLWMRSGGRCEFCREPLHNRVNVHHRKLRSQGGGHEETNLAFVCPECHQWAHANPAAAREHGWIVPSWDDPSEIPVIQCTARMESCSHRE